MRHGPGDRQKNEGGKVSLNYTEPLTGFVILLDSPEKQLIKITTFHNSDMKLGLEIQRKEWKATPKKGGKMQIWVKRGRAQQAEAGVP